MLFSRDNSYNTHFVEMSALLIEAATCLHESLAAGPQSFAAMAKKMVEYESRADKLGMTMFNHLHKSFMTPYDPEDILTLIHDLDEVIDGMEDVAHCLSAYRVSTLPPPMVRMGELLKEASYELEGALKALAAKEDVIKHCLQLARCESEADAVTRDAVADLFANEKDAITIIKCKEIYDYLEKTADAYKHIANILGRIQIKGG